MNWKGKRVLITVKAPMEKIISRLGCVYPNHLQGHPTKEVCLTEDLFGPPYDADNMYRWAKLMGERTLQH